MSIAFLGPAGTFTESALRQIEPDPAHHLPVASVPAALAAVRDGRAASAVVPIENSVEGGVTATLDALADVAVKLNASVENIGARRLQTVMERVLDEISFVAPDKSGEKLTIDAEYVRKHVGDLAANTDLSRYIL